MSGFAHDINGNELVFSGNVDFSGQTVPAATILTNGQMLIGTTALNAGGTHINVGTLTSPDSSITFGYSSPNITAVANAAALNVLTVNATPQFAASGSNKVIDFAITNLVLGSSLPLLTSGTANVGMGPTIMGTLTSGANNTAMGNLALQSITTATSNTVMGFGAGRFITTGSSNTFVGTSSGNATTTGASNTAVGQGSLALFSSGAANTGSNTSIGQGTLASVTTGVQNTALGASAGSAHTTSDSSNIDIKNVGVAGESNTIRIGTQGSGSGQQLQTYIAGVINTVSGRVVKITTPGSYPYTTLTTDYVILVDTSSARTITPLASPVTGTTYRIKDNVGSASSNNITITPSGKNIDGVASYIINTNYGAVDIVYNGTEWSIF